MRPEGNFKKEFLNKAKFLFEIKSKTAKKGENGR